MKEYKRFIYVVIVVSAIFVGCGYTSHHYDITPDTLKSGKDTMFFHFYRARMDSLSGRYINVDMRLYEKGKLQDATYMFILGSFSEDTLKDMKYFDCENIKLHIGNDKLIPIENRFLDTTYINEYNYRFPTTKFRHIEYGPVLIKGELPEIVIIEIDILLKRANADKFMSTTHILEARLSKKSNLRDFLDGR